MLSYSAFRLTVTFHHRLKDKNLWIFLWSQMFILLIMLFDFESKERAECFVGYVSKNEDFLTYKGNTVFYKYRHACTDLDRPRGFQEDEAPRIQDNRHMKVVRSSALCTCRLYPLIFISFRVRALVRSEGLCQ